MASIQRRERSDGKATYRVRWRTGGTAKGAWDSESFPTEREARQFAARITANGDRRPEDKRRTVSSRPDALTVAQLVERYVDDRAKRDCADYTVVRYRGILALHIAPHIGAVLADELSSQQTQDWIDQLVRHGPAGTRTSQPASRKLKANVRGLLSASYKWGQSRELVPGNPCAMTELGRRHKVVRGLRTGEWLILRDAARRTDPDLADLLEFLVGTGLRWGEATGLQVADVDLRRGTAEVAGVMRREKTSAYELVRGTAKTDAGLRKVRLSPAVLAIVRPRVEGRELGDFVFPAERGGALDYAHVHERRWKKVLAEAKARGLRRTPTFHWLRHTQATIMLDNGASLAAVKARMGHANITTTVDLYGAGVDDVPEELLAEVDATLFPDATHPAATLRLVADN